MAQLVEERLATKRDLRDMEERLNHRMQELEYKITFRLGSMIVMTIGIVATLVKLL